MNFLWDESLEIIGFIKNLYIYVLLQCILDQKTRNNSHCGWQTWKIAEFSEKIQIITHLPHIRPPSLAFSRQCSKQPPAEEDT